MTQQLCISYPFFSFPFFLLCFLASRCGHVLHSFSPSFRMSENVVIRNAMCMTSCLNVQSINELAKLGMISPFYFRSPAFQLFSIEHYRNQLYLELSLSLKARCVCVSSSVPESKFQVTAGRCRAQWRLHPTKLSTCAGSRA